MENIAVIAIHGTFAPNATWIESDSELFTQLKRKFSLEGANVDVLPFRWSGKNSISERKKAGDRLARFILDTKNTSNKYKRIFIIAHSHGSTVFSYAVKGTSDVLNVVQGLVAISTPWIHIRKERFALEYRMLIVRIFSVSLLLAALAISIPIITRRVLNSTRELVSKCLATSDKNSILHRAQCDPEFVFPLNIVAQTILFSIVLYICWLIIHKGFLFYVRKSENVFSEKLDKFIENSNTSDVKLPETVLLTSTGDEASSLLKVAQWFSAIFKEILGRLLRTMLHLSNIIHNLSWYFKIPVFIVVHIVIVIIYSAIYLHYFGQFSDIVALDEEWYSTDAVKSLEENLERFDFGVFSVFKNTKVLVLLLVGVAIFLFSSFVYGGRSLGLLFFCRLGVDASPIGAYRIIHVNTNQSVDNEKSSLSTALNHSGIYMYQEGIETLVKELLEMYKNSERAN